MSETKNTPDKKDFRGLTIFELLIISTAILGSILWAVSVRANMQNKVLDEQRRARVTTLKENLMSFVQQNGSFPAEDEFNNEEKRKQLFATYLGDYGQNFINDPKDKSILVSYVAEPEGCSGDSENPCTKITIALKLSNGDQFIKFGVKPGKELEYLNQVNQQDESTQ